MLPAPGSFGRRSPSKGCGAPSYSACKRWSSRAHLVRSEPLFHGFRTVWEGGIRVPLIARCPGRLEPGSTNRQPSISMDLVATLLDAAGRLSDTAGLDGISLLPFLSGARSPGERRFFWRHGTQKAARIGPRKLVVDGETQLLLHLDTDIGERHNVFREQPEVTRRLRDALAEWERSMQKDTAEAVSAARLS